MEWLNDPMHSGSREGENALEVKPANGSGKPAGEIIEWKNAPERFTGREKRSGGVGEPLCRALGTTCSGGERKDGN